MTALLGILRKEFFHIRRDRRTATVLVAIPLVQVLIFGYAIRTDVDDVRLAIVDPAPSHVTQSMRDRLAATGIFRIVAVLPRLEDLDPLFQSGAAQQAIAFGQDFATDIGRNEPAQLLIITDATAVVSTGSMRNLQCAGMIPTTGVTARPYPAVNSSRRPSTLTQSAPTPISS